MFQKILIAVDGSDESLAAVKMANQYVENGLSKEIYLINVATDFLNGTFEMAFSSMEDLNGMTRSYGEKILNEAEQFLTQPATIIKKVILGNAAVGICDYAEENHCDLIIMGSRGNSQLKGLLLGSVSVKVLQYAKCPVLIVKA